MSGWIDSHCHIDLPPFDDGRQKDLLAQCRDAGIETLLVPAINRASFQRLVELHLNYPEQLLFALGFHPWFSGSIEEAEIAQLRTMLEAKPAGLVAVGECGLDFAIENPQVEHQQQLLVAQLELAVAFDLPVILHVRRAHNELLSLLKQYPAVQGVVHGFSGSRQLAEQYIGLGMKLGIGGTITYPRANKTRKALAAIGLEHLLLETDSPDMPLNGFQGQPNTPLQLVAVANQLARLKGVSVEQVRDVTTANSRQLFNIG